MVDLSDRAIDERIVSSSHEPEETRTMSSTIDTRPDETITTTPTGTGRGRWPIFGALAGLTAFFGALAGMPGNLTEEDYQSGVAVLDKLERGGFHVAFILGLVSVGALLLAAAGWRRWAERNAPDDIAAGTISNALTATAAVNLIGYSLMGAMALYLPGGVDENWLSDEAMFTNFAYLDFGVLFGWWGAAVAAFCVAWLSFRSDRVLPRWMGVVSVLLLLPPVLMAIGMSLPGMPGFTMPIWLTIVSLGMLRSKFVRP
jgi:hypothetical protein